MTRMATQEERWDHDRDERKHDTPSRHRLIPPISNALETAVLVRGMKDPREGAKLVEQYAQTEMAAERFRTPLAQRCSVAKLIGYCEGLAASGLLSPETELNLRRNVAETLVAFDMPSKAEREAV